MITSLGKLSLSWDMSLSAPAMRRGLVRQRGSARSQGGAIRRRPSPMLPRARQNSNGAREAQAGESTGSFGTEA